VRPSNGQSVVLVSKFSFPNLQGRKVRNVGYFSTAKVCGRTEQEVGV